MTTYVILKHRLVRIDLKGSVNHEIPVHTEYILSTFNDTSSTMRHTPLHDRTFEDMQITMTNISVICKITFVL